MKNKVFIPLFLIMLFTVVVSCKIETGYRVDIKPQVDKFDDLFMSFQIFINLDHKGKEVEAENDLNLIYEQFDILKNDVKSMPVPSDESMVKFHNLFFNTISFTKDVIDNYRQKFRVEISINNLEAEYRDLSDKLEITKRNFQTAQTSGGKITYRERIVTFQKELEDSKKNLEITRAMYIEILSKIISAEDYYKGQYPEIVKIGKTSVMLSLFPPPDSLISLAERTKYFPQATSDTEE